MTAYHFYAFFNATDALRALADDERDRARTEFLRALRSADGVDVDAYLTLGFRADAAFMLWLRADDVAKAQEFLRRIAFGPAGRFFAQTHALFGMPRESSYGTKPGAQAVRPEDPRRAPYLVVYPFTKTKEWHLLDIETRKKMMAEHIGIGRKHQGVSQMLLYGYGVGDHEFIVSYECGTLEAFQSLVMDLRATEARLYTLADTPVFVCAHRSPEDLAGFMFGE